MQFWILNKILEFIIENQNLEKGKWMNSVEPKFVPWPRYTGLAQRLNRRGRPSCTAWHVPTPWSPRTRRWGWRGGRRCCGTREAREMHRARRGRWELTGDGRRGWGVEDGRCGLRSSTASQRVGQRRVAMVHVARGGVEEVSRVVGRRRMVQRGGEGGSEGDCGGGFMAGRGEGKWGGPVWAGERRRV
jgi:hypothetical protein